MSPGSLDYTNEKSVPVNVEAERSVLGAIMLDAKAIDEAAAIGLVPSDFSLDSHRKIFSAMKRISESTGVIDTITLPAELDRPDVWMRGYFAWEYKGKHKNLEAAYLQLLQYREDLENPPLLIVCDLDRFEVHTNYTNTLKQIYKFTLADLISNQPTATCKLPPVEVLRSIFTDPPRLKPGQTTAQVTEAAAAQFSRLAESLRSRGVPSERAAHFLMRLLFCLFSEDIGLLPDRLFTRLVESNRQRPAEFMKKLRQLFSAMAGAHGAFGEHDIAYFDGGLFSDDEAYDLTTDDLVVLALATALDWSSIEPAIFGTLFERSLDPDKRSQLGAHTIPAKVISG